MYINVYRERLLFGSSDSDHLQGDVFHTVPGKKRKIQKILRFITVAYLPRVRHKQLHVSPWL